MSDDDEVIATSDPADYTIEFTIDDDPKLWSLLIGLSPEEYEAFVSMSDEERTAAGWEAVPKDDPQYDEQYCAWRWRGKKA